MIELVKENAMEESDKSTEDALAEFDGFLLLSPILNRP